MKRLVEECLTWSINDLVRAGIFGTRPGIACSCTWKNAEERVIFTVYFWFDASPAAQRLHVSYKLLASMPDPISYTIGLASVGCHFGGNRRLFLCPGKEGAPCGRRAGKLYLVDGRWLCIACGNLTYLARRTHDKRKDALLRDPATLALALQSDNPRRRILGMGAFAQAVARFTDPLSSVLMGKK